MRMVEQRPSGESEWAAMRRIAPLLGVTTAETLRKWSTSESQDLRRLRRENAELKRANSILKAASAFFAAELDRPHG